MNILLWVLQCLIAFWNITGGVYMAMNYEQLKGGWGNDLPKVAWMVLCLLQVLFALGLIVPGMVRLKPKLTSISAVYLAVNSLLGCLLFAQYAGFPGMLWGVIPAILTALVAYGRIVLS